MKNKYIIFTSIFLVILFFISFSFNKNKSNTTIDKSKKIYIYDRWVNDITSYKNDEILYQFAIYDFNNEIDIDKSNLINLLLDNTPHISLTDYKLEYTGEDKNVKFYTLSLYIKIDKLGLYKLNDLNLKMSINNKVYNFSLGNSIIKIIEKTNDLDTIGGSAIISKKFDDDIYDLYYEIKNTTNHKIVLNDLKLNNQAGIKILKSDINNLIINPNEQKKLI